MIFKVVRRNFLLNGAVFDEFEVLAKSSDSSVPFADLWDLEKMVCFSVSSWVSEGSIAIVLGQLKSGWIANTEACTP